MNPKKYTLLLFILLKCCTIDAEKSEIIGSDTFPYKDSIWIPKKSSLSAEYTSKDTSGIKPCPTFEWIHNRKLNITDQKCQKQGLWIESEGNNGLVSTGQYNSDVKVGVWRTYDDTILLRETEYKTFNRRQIIVKDLSYSTGKPHALIDHWFYAIYIDTYELFYLLLILLIPAKIIVNAIIVSLEDKTPENPQPSKKFSVSIGFYSPNRVNAKIFRYLWPVWFLHCNGEHRMLKLTSNVLTLMIIGLAVFIYFIAQEINKL